MSGYTDADVQLVAQVLFAAGISSATPHDDARSVLNALAAAGRLLPDDVYTEEEYQFGTEQRTVWVGPWVPVDPPDGGGPTADNAEKTLHLVTQYGQACEIAYVEDTKTAHAGAEALYGQIAALVREPALVFSVHKAALQEIDGIVGNELTLDEDDTTRIRGVLAAALNEGASRG